MNYENVLDIKWKTPKRPTKISVRSKERIYPYSISYVGDLTGYTDDYLLISYKGDPLFGPPGKIAVNRNLYDIVFLDEEDKDEQ